MAIHIRRREFIFTLGGAAAAWPRAARAQQARKIPRIGVLWPNPPARFEFMRQGLQDFGYVEGRNIGFEFRWAEGKLDRLPELARRHVTVVAALGVAAAVAAKRATATIPVVFYMGEDPVGLGLVPSFNHPGGNLTGVATLSSEVMAKRLELLHEIAPRADAFAALINPKNPSAAISAKEAQNAAHALGKSIYIVHASAESELEPAFATIAQLRAGGLLIAPDGLFIAYAAQVAALSLRHAIPASDERRAFPDAGGLMSYGANQADGIRLAGVYTGRILKGEKPADLPVMQSTKFEFVINLNTAKSLGLEISPTLLALAVVGGCIHQHAQSSPARNVLSIRREIMMPDQTSEKAEVKMYSDFKSPYAYLAFDPGMTLGQRFDVRVRWIPFQLRVKGKGERSVYSEYKVKYSYMDARRWAKRRGLWIRGPLKVYDTTAAAIGGLFAETQGRLLDYGREAFKRFFLREFEADQPEAVARLIAGLGLSDRHYLEYLAGEGAEAYDRCQQEAAADHVFGVPFFLFGGEPFWGYDRLPLLEQRLEEAGLAISDKVTAA